MEIRGGGVRGSPLSLYHLPLPTTVVFPPPFPLSLPLSHALSLPNHHSFSLLLSHFFFFFLFKLPTPFNLSPVLIFFLLSPFTSPLLYILFPFCFLFPISIFFLCLLLLPSFPPLPSFFSSFPSYSFYLLFKSRVKNQ